MILTLVLTCALTWLTLGDHAPCPDSCHCHKDSDQSLVRIRCSGSRIPDLSPLTQDDDVKELVLDAYENGNAINIERKIFYPGLKIRSLVVKAGSSTIFFEGCFRKLNDFLQSLRIGNEVTFNTTLLFLKGLTKLKRLDLKNNKQYWTRENNSEVVDLFKGLGLRELTYLDVSYCFIYRLSEDVFSGVEGIHSLDLSGNRLSEVPSALSVLSRLAYLDLSFNRIPKLGSKPFANLKNLKTLRLAGNEFGELLPDAFFGLERSLLTLDLQMTKQHKISTQSLERLSALKNLNMSENPFKVMEENSLKGDYCLYRLDLHYTQVIFHGKMFAGQEDCIEVLSLYRPKIDYIPTDAIASLKRLEVLEFQGAEVKVLKTDSLKGIRAKVLDLSFLPLTHIEESAFDNLEMPLTLMLRETSLTNIDFLLDYQEGTFSKIEIGGSLMCGCDLVAPVNHAGCVLQGSCSKPDDFEVLDLNDLEFRKYLSECSDKLSHFSCSALSNTGVFNVVSNIVYSLNLLMVIMLRMV